MTSHDLGIRVWRQDFEHAQALIIEFAQSFSRTPEIDISHADRIMFPGCLRRIREMHKIEIGRSQTDGFPGDLHQ